MADLVQKVSHPICTVKHAISKSQLKEVARIRKKVVDELARADQLEREAKWLMGEDDAGS